MELHQWIQDGLIVGLYGWLGWWARRQPTILIPFHPTPPLPHQPEEIPTSPQLIVPHRVQILKNGQHHHWCDWGSPDHLEARGIDELEIVEVPNGN